jgi:periplasmic protein TonB
MFTTLVESRAVRQRSVKGTITSIVLHAMAVGAAVAVSVTSNGGATEAPPPAPAITYTIADPPPTPVIDRPSHPSPSQPALPATPARVVIAPIDIPTTLPSIDLAATPIGDDRIIITRGGRNSESGDNGSAGITGIPSGGAYPENVVERMPRLVGRAIEPRYPNSLRSSGISGRVVVRFVVDTLGRAEEEGTVIVEATHPLFTEAVRNVLALYRFSPGEVGGRKVRTLVQMPFAFTLR